MPGFASLAMLNLDCADPGALADFYHEVLGWDIAVKEDMYAMIGDGTVNVGFGKVDGYRPSSFPDETTPKQYHLDLYVDDLDDAEARCLKLGATKPDEQPGETWRVMLDPAGHPFCLCVKPAS